MTTNHLIDRLPRADRKRLLDACQPVQLNRGELLLDPGEETRYAYFPTGGIVSLITSTEEHPDLEVGMVGNEGMVGMHLRLGVKSSPLRALVHAEGPALRLRAKDFRAELASSPALQRTLDLYLFVLMAQGSTSAACLRFHQIGPRLARWLLMTQDRSGRGNFKVTQEFLAYLLGVRRVGITLAAGVLQQAGLIAYQRGAMTVLDRRGLERAACSCYGTTAAVYAAHL